jgi:ABC-2 type transport system permease protein
MGGAFLYLTICSIRNRVRVRLKRLREPRYLLGLVAGLLYFGFLFGRPRRRQGAAAAAGPALPVALYRGALEVCGAAFLLVLAAMAWVFPRAGRPALTFTPADVHFLFAAPVSRRQLINYKIFRSQAGVVLGGAITTLVFRSAAAVETWMFFTGMLFVMATINLHLTGVSLRRESLLTHGRKGLARQWAAPVIVIAATAVVGWAAVDAWPTLSSASGPADLFREIERVGTSGPAGLVLWPFRALIQLPFSATMREFVVALPLAAGILAANYLWVVRSDVAFEEASARFAEGHAAGPRRSGAIPVVTGRRPPFTLAATGRPEIAILWKNLILAGRYASWTGVLRALPVVLLGAFALSQTATSAAGALGLGCAVMAAGATLLGPQILRNDLRQDLTQIAALKLWPVSGAAVVRGEIFAPAVLLSVFAWLLIVSALLLSTSAPMLTTLPLLDRVSYAAAAMIVAPGLITTELVVQNALALMFPAWIELGSARSTGVEVMGQRMLVAGALLTAVALALLPALAVGLALAWLLHAVTGIVFVLPPALVIAAALGVESFLAMAALGRLFERMDATSVLPEE